jgi:hypothetical protein
MNKKNFPHWIADRIENGTARVLPHGTIKVIPLRTMADKLASIKTLDELEGFANRRRYAPDLPRWTESERAAILARKYELERGK